MRKILLIHGTRDWMEITAGGQVSIVEMSRPEAETVELRGLDYRAIRNICATTGVSYLYGSPSDMPEVRAAKSRIEHLPVSYDYAQAADGSLLIGLTPERAMVMVLAGHCARREGWATPCFIRKPAHQGLRYFVLEGGYAPDRWTPYFEDFERDDWAIVVPRSQQVKFGVDVSGTGEVAVSSAAGPVPATRRYSPADPAGLRTIPVGEDDGTVAAALSPYREDGDPDYIRIEDCGIDPQDIGQ